MGAACLGSQAGQVAIETLFLIDEGRDLQRRPDVAFISNERWPVDRNAPNQETWDVVPDLAVEVVSPSNTTNEVLGKVREYFRAGIRRVWVVSPRLRQAYVYGSPTQATIVEEDSDLDGAEILPGFCLRPAEVLGPVVPDGQ
jgi:Uma2 family endonuclease